MDRPGLCLYKGIKDIGKTCSADLDVIHFRVLSERLRKELGLLDRLLYVNFQNVLGDA
jgi:hypothetical protein